MAVIKAKTYPELLSKLQSSGYEIQPMSKSKPSHSWIFLWDRKGMEYEAEFNKYMDGYELQTYNIKKTGRKKGQDSSKTIDKAIRICRM